MDFTRAGSFRQRVRNADRTTKQSREHRRQRVAVHTHEAIQDFEEHLRTVQDSGVIDDLPMSAEANTIPRDNASDASSTANRTSFMRSQGDLHRSASASAGLDIDHRYTMRPPSPLSMYDYGAISTRPRSLLAQRSKAPGEAMRPSSRQAGGPGFYFPGPEFRQGSYGFSMMEPIHMPPRVWTETKQPPHRWPRDPSDVRPATTECNEHRHRRSRTAGPFISDIVRSNTTHDLRAAHAFRSLDKKTEEIQLEEVRFQQGMFDGRFRDPMLDAGVSGPALVASSAAHCHFLAEDHSDAPEAQQVASRLLFGIEEALTQSKGHLKSLFKSVNRGTVGSRLGAGMRCASVERRRARAPRVAGGFGEVGHHRARAPHPRGHRPSHGSHRPEFRRPRQLLGLGARGGRGAGRAAESCSGGREGGASARAQAGQHLPPEAAD
mmetsp:Transcript_25984/g.86539  ORF Transcript_25984/g.86539 Transcript_25984/m.86539 type:complete len:436 (-) Transcript_25984:259-1566(-)